MQHKLLTILSICLIGIAVSCNNSKKQDETDPVSDSSLLVNEPSSGVADSADRKYIADMVIAFIKAYNERDNAKIKSFINTDAGLMIIHRPGAMDWFEKVSVLDFNKPIPSYYPYASAENNYSVEYDVAPTFDCSLEKWSKEGLIIDLTTQTNFLGPIAVSLKEFDDVELDPDYEAQIELAEKDSYRVVLTTKTPLIFHVKQIDNSWYVTILDRGYADCGA
ncbi:hypothetical protein ACFSQ3_04840 [Sphingobacterium corticis]|uniref:Uncharacterized protein n=1 Tax=Sphingobacterium corticis TaxID=1812823 RepID=A0ABW5NH89_9SPHI